MMDGRLSGNGAGGLADLVPNPGPFLHDLTGCVPMQEGKKATPTLGPGRPDLHGVAAPSGLLRGMLAVR